MNFPPQGLNTANYFNSANTLGEEKEDLTHGQTLETLSVSVWPVVQFAQRRPHPYFEVQLPWYIGNFAVEMLETIVREKFINDRKMKLAFLVLTSHDKRLNKNSL